MSLWDEIGESDWRWGEVRWPEVRCYVPDLRSGSVSAVPASFASEGRHAPSGQTCAYPATTAYQPVTETFTQFIAPYNRKYVSSLDDKMHLWIACNVWWISGMDVEVGLQLGARLAVRTLKEEFWPLAHQTACGSRFKSTRGASQNYFIDNYVFWRSQSWKCELYQWDGGSVLATCMLLSLCLTCIFLISATFFVTP